MSISSRLKALLKRFGEVQATTSFYAGYQPDGPVEHPGEHYPVVDLERGEPVLIVKISPSGESSITPAIQADGRESEVVKVMELPEDEFWYFEAFRPALSRLSLGAPGFLFEMELVTLYGVFEAYLADTLRDRLRRNPRFLSQKARRALEALGDSAAHDPSAVDTVIDGEVRRLGFGSITALLAHMRSALDMPGLTTRLDGTVQTAALVRNCLLHAAGRVDQRLAAAEPHYSVGELIELDRDTASRMAKALRDLAYAVDQ
jgi:hypothetical protein